ncbi:TonB-dependent receptor [soil metagenome]
MKSFVTVEKKPFFLKLLLIMKLTVVLIMLFSLQASADGFGQQKISLKFKKTEIADILASIEKKTNYRFLYNNDLAGLRQKISLNMQDAELKQVLDQIFTDTDLAYEFMQNNLVVIKEDNAPEIKAVVTGTVTGENNIPLSGVAVQVKGTSKGTTTNAQGAFTINAEATDILVFSYIGYELQEVPVAGKAEINVSLKATSQALTDVVVIGYGTASKRDLTGSIVKVAGKDIADKPNTNPVASLQGKVAGLSVVNSGQPGQEPDIRIRGTGSLNQTKPLYVVDGIFNDNISYINPSDIESMEILKDPSSLAIFGVRGANGVIIITTKKGKAGKLVVNLNSSIGFKTIVDKVKLTDASGFKTLFDEENANEGNAPYTDYDLFNGNSDWIDLISNKNAIISSNNISISSGTEKNKFYMSAGYIKEEGLIKYENLDKFILTMSDELKVSKAIKVGYNITGYRSLLPQLKSFSGALIATPIVSAAKDNRFEVYNKLPELIGGPQIGNPVMGVEETKNTQLPREQRLLGSIYTEINFLKNFTFRANVQADFGFNDGRNYTPLIYVYAAEIDTIALQGGYTRTSVSQYKNTYQKFQQDYVLTFKKQFGDHGLTALAGFTTYFEDFSSINGSVLQSATGDPIPNDKRWWYLNVFPYGDPSTRVSNSDQWERSTASGLFRVLYNFKGRYLLNGSYRRDGSSEISPAQRFDDFWAVGGAWEVSREDFMANQDIFDYLKLKASIGKLGNQYNAVHYPYYPNYIPGASAVFGELIVPAYQLAYRNNPTLKWETVNSYEAGFELDMLKRRLHFDANYYHRKTNDLLAFVNDGAAQFYTNSGSIENKGFEFQASWSETFKSGFGYSLSGNLTTIKNKVISIFKEGYKIDAGQSVSEAGLPIGYFYGWVVDGLYQSTADKAKSPDASYFGSYGAGDIKYKDINGDNIINEKDRQLIGNPTPDFTYGFSVSANYNGFDFGVDFQGVYGNEIWRSFGNGNSFAQFNYREDRLDRWTTPGSSNWEPRVGDFAINKVNSTYMIEDGSYIRLRNVQVGYTFNANLLAKAHISSLRIYVSGQNLKTWKNNSGFTPEAGGSAIAFGIDGGGYPVPAITTFGLNLTF